MIELPTIDHVEIDWMHGYANTPHINVYVNEAWGFPSPYETWPHRMVDDDGNGQLYLATNDIWAHFVYDASERDSGRRLYGMRGACTGELLLESGRKQHITSGWSSGSDVLNHYLAPEDHIIDVTLRGGKKYESLGRAGLAIRKDALEPLLPEGVYLVDKPLGRGPYYVASVNPDTYEKAAKP